VIVLEGSQDEFGVGAGRVPQLFGEDVAGLGVELDPSLDRGCDLGGEVVDGVE
jgi:hypothetical protein